MDQAITFLSILLWQSREPDGPLESPKAYPESSRFFRLPSALPEATTVVLAKMAGSIMSGSASFGGLPTLRLAEAGSYGMEELPRSTVVPWGNPLAA